MSEQLGVVSVQMVIDSEPIYCINYVLSVDDNILCAYHRSLRDAGELYRIQAVNWGLESLVAICAI